MAIRRVTGAVSPSELVFADANALGTTYDGAGTTIERGETFTLPSAGTTAVSNGALRLEALKGDCTITNNGNSTLTNASGVNGTVIMRSGASDFPAFVRNSSMGSMSTHPQEDFAGSLNSSVSFPSGSVLQVLQYYKNDRDSVTGSAHSTGQGANAFAFIPGQGSDAVFQQGITTTGLNKVLITHYGNYGCSAINYTLALQLFRGAASNTVIGSCTKLGAGIDVGNTKQTESNLLMQTTGGGGMETASFSYLDSPGAGTHYYKMSWLGETGQTHYINRSGTDGNYAYLGSTSSSLTVMEVQV